MKRPILLPSNTVMRYAVAPGDMSLAYIDGMNEHWPKVPQEDAVLNVPFLVDPTTRLPVPARVIQLQYRLQMTPPTIVIVVGRHH